MILNPTESPLLGGSAPYCSTISSAMYLSLLLLEIICQGTQASTLSEHWCQSSPQLPGPAITPKQQRTFRKQQGQTYGFFHPITDLPHDPAQDILPFHAWALYQGLMILAFNSVTYALITKVLNKYVITCFSELHSTPQDRALWNTFSSFCLTVLIKQKLER